MTAEQKVKARWLDVLDALAKLVGASALVAGAYIANSYQSRMTGTTLLSQREMAESQLRASMFTSLIQPVAGFEKDRMIRLDREGLLVELLALNFHEHFEVKPLMESIDARLASQRQDGMTPGEIQEARNSLRSIARRVTAQELASVIREQAASASSRDGCTNYILSVGGKSPVDGSCEWSGAFEEPVTIYSPDRRWSLVALATHPDWDNETFEVSISAMTNPEKNGGRNYRSLEYKFKLSWFNFPLTDNTLLPDGNRFAVTLQTVNKMDTARLEIVWFPKDYVTPRERPLNNEQYLELIGKRLSR
jgi:hypothetical protein